MATVAANFTEIIRKHVFTANTIKNRVKKKKSKQISPKIYSFLFKTLNCIINYAYLISNDIIQLTSKDALFFKLRVLKVSF